MRGHKLICKAFHSLEWEPFDIPHPPAPREIVMQASCALISAGTELAVYSGTHIGYSTPDAVWPRLPVDMGYALAGTVRAIGRDVREFRIGDRVVARATHGDWAVVNVDTTIVRPIPALVSMEQAALASLGAISLLGVRQATPALGEVGVVMGLGLIGQFAAQLLRLSGVRTVFGVDVIPARLELAASNGIRAIDARQGEAAQQIQELTAGRMAEIVIEATGNPAVVPGALRCAAEGGRFVLLGSLRGKIEIDAYTMIHRKGISLIGANERLASPAQTIRDPWTRQRNIDLVLGLLADGSLATAGFITRRVQPGAITETYEWMIQCPSEYLGVLIEWDEKGSVNGSE